MVDVDGAVRSWNSGAERLKGYSADEIIGKPFSSFYSPEDRAKGLPQTALRIAAETGRFSSEGWRVRKDGSRFWASVVVDAIRNEQGQVIGFAKVNARHHGTSAGPQRTSRERTTIPSIDRGRRRLCNFSARSCRQRNYLESGRTAYQRLQSAKKLSASTSADSTLLKILNLASLNWRSPRRPNKDASRLKAGECERMAVAFGRQLSSIASLMRLANSLVLQK